MNFFTKRKYTLLFIGTIFLIGVGIFFYWKYFAYFPIEKRRLVRILKSVPRVYLDNYGKNISFRSDGLKIVGTLYGGERDGKNPCIILLHGSSPYGRKLALYRILGRKFAELGYIALSFDFRGFGESEDPTIGDLNMFNFYKDVSNALDFVTSKDNVDVSKIYLVGHSLGGNIAFVLGTKDERIRKIVAIGPSRRVKERVLKELDKASFEGKQLINAHEYRVSRDMQLEGMIQLKLIKESVLSMLIDNYAIYYAQDGHKPLLLIDGELEDDQDKLFLRRLSRQLTPPSEYVTFRNVGHYHNTINWDGKALVLYDPQAVDELVEFIDHWLRNTDNTSLGQ
jgi:pimeloyl-ACP methyl ester carboxylesterase